MFAYFVEQFCGSKFIKHSAICLFVANYLPKTITKVILIVLILALGITPRELIRLKSASSVADLVDEVNWVIAFSLVE